MNLLNDSALLAYVFACLMGLAMLIYAILDGFDLGVGMMINSATDKEKDQMIASIGPFWDANETWLVLGAGLLLVAFPMAHGKILTELYAPVTVMLFGVIFRGVAFDFRSKAPPEEKPKWNRYFFLGSLIAALAQGYMLGSYIIGFNDSLAGMAFSTLIAVCLASAYCLMGACWLILKCQDTLQLKAIRWAKYHLITSLIGLMAVSLATPLLSQRIFNKWFNFPELLLLAPIPLMTGILIIGLLFILKHMPFPKDQYAWLPLALTIGVYMLSFFGLAYSFFPYIIPEQMTIPDAAAAPASLRIMLFGVITVFPILLCYTAYSHYVFRGKAQELSYD